MLSDEEFFKKLLNPRDKKKLSELSLELFKKPVRDKAEDATTFAYISTGYIQQADLLYLPNDQGYALALVVIDQGSRKVDAVALKGKTAEEVLDGFKTIYKRKILQIPEVLTVDQGTEFKGITQIGLKKLGIHVNYIKKGRHRAVGLVERKNQTIGNLIQKRIAYDKAMTKQASSKWVSYLPTIISTINSTIDKVNAKFIKDFIKKNIKFDSIKLDSKSDIKKEPEKEKSIPPKVIELLPVGTRVRVQLDEPEHPVDGTKLIGKFRSGDIRWSKVIRTIKEVIMKPNQPILYLLNGNFGELHIETIGYTRNQLQVVTKDAEKVIPEPPEKRDINETGRFEVQSLIDKKIVKKVVYYLVKWKGYHKKHSSWEKRTELMKDIPQLVNLYDKKEEAIVQKAKKINTRVKA